MRFCLLMLCAMLLSMATCVPAFAEEAAETQTKNSPSQAQQLEPVTVVDENDSRRRIWTWTASPTPTGSRPVPGSAPKY